MKVKKEYTLTKDDFVNFGFYIARKSIVFETAVIFAAAFAASYIIVDRRYFLIGGIIGVIVSAVIIIPIMYYSTYKHTLRNYENYAKEFSAVETSIDGRGFTQKSKIGKTTVPFDKIYKVCESKHGIYVYVSSRQAIILPKNIFNDDLKIIRELFGKNMPGRKVHLYKIK